MQNTSNGLVDTMMGLPVFHAEWILWLLLVLSVVSVAVMIERFVFYRRHRVDIDRVRENLERYLDEGDFAAAARYLAGFDSLETNVVLYGLRSHALGPESVQDLLAGAERKERSRFERRLGFLATTASNAPFLGLFGTVLGIIRALNDLSANISEPGQAVMAGISEALITTAVGLIVAIPAVIAYNVFKGRVKGFADNAQLLAGSLLSNLKSEMAPAGPAREPAVEGAVER